VDSVDGHTPPTMEYVIGFHMGIGKVIIRFVLIGIIDVPIGKTYGFNSCTNMEVQQLEVIFVQTMLLSSSTSRH
jgi:hypothetical protein